MPIPFAELGKTKVERSADQRYALLFRTHFWDEFSQRQFDRIREKVSCADVYVLVDETRGEVANIRAENVFRLTDEEIISAGFISTNDGSIQWFSGDVPLYMFWRAFPQYDYYIQMEYDVCVNLNVDKLVDRLRLDAVDVLALRNKDTGPTWHWRSTCIAEYQEEEIRCLLICFSGFSNNALSVLQAARLAQAVRYKEGVLNEWPYCEGFVGSETLRQGLKLSELSDYGDVVAYDWWPPFCEKDLKGLSGNSFIHPVLDNSRYIASLFKRPGGMRWLLWPNSWLHRRFRRLGFWGYVGGITSDPFRRAVRTALSNRFRHPSRSS